MKRNFCIMTLFQCWHSLAVKFFLLLIALAGATSLSIWIDVLHHRSKHGPISFWMYQEIYDIGPQVLRWSDQGATNNVGGGTRIGEHIFHATGNRHYHHGIRTFQLRNRGFCLTASLPKEKFIPIHRFGRKWPCKWSDDHNHAPLMALTRIGRII